MLFRPERGSFKKFQKYRNFQEVFVKQWNFYHLIFFLGKSIQKRVFCDILNKKECFLDKEKEVLQKSKNSIFSMVFVKKLNFLSSVFLGESS